MKTQNNIKNYLKFEPKAQKLDLKVPKLDLKVPKLDLKAKKLDLKAKKLDFSAFQLSGVGWTCAQKKKPGMSFVQSNSCKWYQNHPKMAYKEKVRNKFNHISRRNAAKSM